MRRCARASALRELGTLAGLLQPGLPPLLGPGVPGQQPASLQLAPKISVALRQRPGYPVAHRTRLSGNSASVHSYSNVHLALVAGGQQRLANQRLVLVAREVLLEAALVDLKAAAPGAQDHTRDRGLSLARGLDSRVAGKLHGGLARWYGLLATLGLRLHPRPVLGGELALGLDLERLELGSGRTLLLGIGARGSLACGYDFLGWLRLGLLLILGRLGCFRLWLLDVAVIRLGLRRGGLILRRLILRHGLFLAALGQLLVLAALVVCHQASTSIRSGFCASWGCSGPA